MILFLLLIPTNSEPVYPVPYSMDNTGSINLSIEGTISEVSLGDNTQFITVPVTSHYNALGDIYSGHSFFHIPNRPEWMIGENPNQTFIFIGQTTIGEILFYHEPKFHFNISLIPIPLRIFVNVGWALELPPIACEGQCDEIFPFLKFTFKTSCQGPLEENNVFWNLRDDEEKFVNPFPFRVDYNILEDQLLPIIVTDASESPLAEISKQIRLWTYSKTKFSTPSQLSLVKQKLKLCMYTDPGNGVHISNIEFHISENDTQGLIFFLIFLGIFFPFICIVTLLLHCNSLKRQRQFVTSVNHYRQRIQLEEEMSGR